MTERAYTLITGGAGFVGCNLADALLTDGEPVVVADNLSRAGVQRNARWLQEKHGDRVRFERADVRDAERVRHLVHGAKQIFHLAAQVAVTTSLEDPALDLETNVIGTFNVLEAARSMPVAPPILFTSTNKVYGVLEEVRTELHGEAYRYADGRRGITEAAPLDFYSPYGCSKGAADQYVRDYARIFGLPTVVFRMSCIYGPRQFGTEDQGWVAHFARSILGGAPIRVYGDGFQVRDVLWVEDLVRAMREAVARLDAVSGEVFNIGGGADNAVSVRGVIDRIGGIVGQEVPVLPAEWRPGDQRVYVSDLTKAERTLDWKPTVTWKEGLERLVEWLRGAGLAGPALPLNSSVRGADPPAMVPVAP